MRLRIYAWLAVMLGLLLGLTGELAWAWGPWRSVVVDGQEGTAGQSTSLDLDEAGRPHISYCAEGANELRYASYDGTGWETETIDPNGCLDTSLVIDALDEPHISYHSGILANLMYTHYYEGSWHVQTVDSKGEVGEHSALALDEARLPHIVYWDRTNKALKYARRVGPNWQFDTIDEPVDIVAKLSLALDSAGHPHVLYRDHQSPAVVKYAHNDGNGWQIEPIAEEWPGLYSSLALDSRDRPHVAYENRGLIYAHKDGTQWQRTQIDAGTTTGDGNALVLDGAGWPHIAYGGWPYPEHVLKYAYFDGFDWQLETVDTSGGTSNRFEDMSLAVADDGTPHIGYYDLGAYDLKYATRAAPSLKRNYLPLVFR
jgi:hypothetical protein